jgi:hypothetical protein
MTTLAFDSLMYARKPGEAGGAVSRGISLMRRRGSGELASLGMCIVTRIGGDKCRLH